jgi:hypothetical protein
MGFDFTKGAKKTDIVKRLIADRPRFNNGRDSFDVSSKTVAHKVIGSSLWMVVEQTKHFKLADQTKRLIVLAVLENKRGFGYGYNSHCEEAHPYYYDCPLEFLDMVPVASEDWRKGVREYHRRMNAVLVPNTVYNLEGANSEYMTLMSVLPLLGRSPTGKVFRYKKEWIVGPREIDTPQVHHLENPTPICGGMSNSHE